MVRHALKVGDHAKTTRACYGLHKGDEVIITYLQNYNPKYSARIIKTWNGCNVGNTFTFNGTELEITWKNWKEKAEAMKDDIKARERALKKLKKEYEILTKYKDEEDYLAHKMVNILKNKDDVEAVRTLIKEFKTDLM